MKTMMNETPNQMINTNSRRNNKMKKFTKILKNQKGLTLIELLAVIVILAIVAAIAVPSIGGIINNSRDKAVLAEASTIIAGAKLAYTNGDCKGKTAATPAAVAADNEICDNGEIQSYVDGITLAPTDQVAKADWELTWSGLATDKFSSATSKYIIASPATEAAILAKLDQ